MGLGVIRRHGGNTQIVMKNGKQKKLVVLAKNVSDANTAANF
jgi:hypothetical protein